MSAPDRGGDSASQSSRHRHRHRSKGSGSAETGSRSGRTRSSRHRSDSERAGPTELPPLSACMPAINPEDFLQPDFSCDVFMDSLTSKILQGGSAKKLDERATFHMLTAIMDEALGQLTRLGDRLDSQIGALAQGMGDAEVAHRQRMAALDSHTEELMESFRQLDKSIVDVSATAVRIGEQLGTLDTQRQRALDAQELLQVLTSFNAGDRKRLDPVFTDRSRAHQAVMLLHKMSDFSKELTMAGGKYAVACKLMDEVEAELNDAIFKEFDDANRAFDLARMMQCAKTLHHCNKEEYLYRRYLGTLSMFGDPTEDMLAMQKCMPNRAEGLKAVCNGIVNAVNAEHERIAQIFTAQPSEVMRLLMERLFADRIQYFVEQILNSAQQQGRTAYLEMLELSHRAILDVVAKLRTLKHASSDTVDLPAQMRNVFGLFREEYVNVELYALQEQYQVEITQLQRLGAAPAGEPVEEAVSRMIVAHERALNRCSALSFEKDLAGNYEKIMNVLLLYMDKFLGILVAGALVALRRHGWDGNAWFFEVVRVAGVAVCRLRTHVMVTFLSLTALLPHVQAAALASFRELTAVVEKSVVEGLEFSLRGIETQLQTALSRQPTQEFSPRDDEFDVNNNVTRTCYEACQIVSRQHQAVSRCLDGKNLESFLTEFGIRFERLILDHMKKFTINTNGGLRLMRDLTEYQEVIRAFSIAALNERFSVLRELGNLYLVAPENLRNLIRESGLAKLRDTEVHAYVAQRADYRSANIAQYFTPAAPRR